MGTLEKGEILNIFYAGIDDCSLVLGPFEGLHSSQRAWGEARMIISITKFAISFIVLVTA